MKPEAPNCKMPLPALLSELKKGEIHVYMTKQLWTENVLHSVMCLNTILQLVALFLKVVEALEDLPGLAE